MPTPAVGNRSRALVMFGVATCVYWLSRAVFPALVYPLTKMPDFGGILGEVQPWIREMVPSLNRPDSVVLEKLRREFLVVAVEQWAFIVGGTLAGVLVAFRRKGGRWTALVLAALVLSGIVVSEVRLVIEHGRDSFQIWAIMARKAPLHLLRKLIDLVFCGLTMLFLARGTTGRAFDARPGETGTGRSAA